MENKQIAIGVVVAVLAIASGFYIYGTSRSSVSDIPEDENKVSAERMMINFSEGGYIVSDNPGLVPNLTYFIYEEPGASALTLPIKLTADSQCVIGEQTVGCATLSAPLDMVFKDKRVRIEGYLENSMLSVVTIQTISE